MSQWTLFSNHGHVLLFLAREPDARLRDVAEQVGITERAVQKIVRDLQDGGAVSVSKKGRRNRYRINMRKPLRHELEAHRTIGNLVKLITPDPEPEKRAESAPPAPRPAVPAEPPPAEPRPATPEKPLAEPEPSPAPEPEAKPKPPTRKKAAKKKKPDDDQQGSLF